MLAISLAPTLVYRCAGGGVMKAFLATVLSVIAVGVLLIAYGLITARAPMAAAYPDARPMVASERVGFVDAGAMLPQATAYGYASRPAIAYPVNAVRPLSDSEVYAVPPRATATRAATTIAPLRTTTIER